MLRAAPTRRTSPLSSARVLARRGGAAATIVAAVLAFGAPTASAHGAASDDVPASNYRSVVTDTAEVPGITVRTVEAGSQLEVVNTGDDEIVVFDYDGRPYLRIGPEGVLENQNSPAVYLNQSSDASALVPDGIGDGPPDWVRVSREPSYRWHDHRAHWMGGDPPLVVARPDQRQTVAEWTVPLDVGERRVEVEGITEWVPAPSPLPWLALATLLAAVIVALTLRRRIAAAIAIAAVGIGASSVAVAVGSWQATAEAAIGKLPMLALPVLVLSLLLGALSLAGSRPSDSLILAAGAGATAALTTALTSGDWLTRSQLPTQLAPMTARAAVAVTVGAGAGLAIAATWLIARPILTRRTGWAPRSDAAAEPDVDHPRVEADVDAASGVTDDEPAPVVVGASRMRRTLLIGFIATMIGVGVAAELAIGGPDNDDQSGIATICRAVASAPDDGGTALRDAFGGPAHDDLHELAARTEATDRAVAGDLLRAKQQIEASLTDPDAALDPGAALPTAIRRATATLDIPAPDDCTLEPT